jgi:hypothetical protein
VVLLLSAFSGGKTGVGKIVSCNVDPSIISGVQSGDLVLRCGRGFISNAMRNFSIQEKKYSHAGIAVIENGKVFVCHMLGDEVEDSMSDFLKEPFELFCSPNGNSSFAVYRYKLSREQTTQFIKSLEELSSKIIPFDAQFDLESDEKLYCTELIYKCLQKSSNNSNYLPLSRIGNRSYVAIDNLYLNNHCKKIASFSNK